MRKWRILSLALAVLAAVVLIASACVVHGAGQDVSYTETLLEGSPEDFSGVAVTAQTALGNSVHWTTRMLPGSGEAAQSVCRYGALPYTYPTYTPELAVGIGLFQGAGSEQESMILSAAAEKLAAQAPEHTWYYDATMRAADLTDALPLRASWSDEYHNFHDADEAFQAFFAVPIPEDLLVSVGIAFADGENHAAGASVQAIAPVDPAEEDWSFLYCRSAWTDGSFYFTLDLHRFTDESAIYRFTPETGVIETACPLPAGTRIRAIWCSADGDTLYLIHTLGDELLLTAFAVPDMTEKQTLSLPFAPDAVFCTPILQKDTTLVLDDAGNVLALSGKDGLLQPEVYASLADSPILPETEESFSLQEMLESFSLLEMLESRLRLDAAFQVRDGRLVIAVTDASENEEAPPWTSDYYLLAYFADGRCSVMQMRSSLEPDLRTIAEYGNPSDLRHLRTPDDWLTLEVTP